MLKNCKDLCCYGFCANKIAKKWWFKAIGTYVKLYRHENMPISEFCSVKILHTHTHTIFKL